MVCPADAVVFPDSPAPPAQRATMVAAFLGTSAGYLVFSVFLLGGDARFLFFFSAGIER